MSKQFNESRRRFLQISVAAGGGLLIGFHLPVSARRAHAEASTGDAFEPNAFIRIARDDTVTIIVNKSEMGQGVYTALPMLVAEELECDWNRISVESAPAAPAYYHTQWGPYQGTGGSSSVISTWDQLREAGAAAREMLVAEELECDWSRIRVESAPAAPPYYHTQWGPYQGTGGSSSVISTWDQLREAGAAAREMLVAAAAASWGVPAESCRARDSYVIHENSGRRQSFGALADRAAQMPVPEAVLLKDPEEFRIIGRPTKRLDSPEKVNGQAIFGLDVDLPGMLIALVERPPVFGASVKDYDDKAARAVAGVREVVVIDGGVAIVADSFWQAKKGRDALIVHWNEGPNGALSSEALWRKYADLAEKPGVTVKQEGDAEAALAGAAKRLDAVYELPYLAHAAMEPLNCVADVRTDRCDIWAGTQLQTGDQQAAARIAGLEPEAVRIHTTFLGGGFGRRASPNADFVSMAVQVSKAVRRPVKVIWTREDDMRGGYYRPMHYSRLAAGLDNEGTPVAWTHRLLGESIVTGTPFEGLIENGIDKTSIEGAADMPYAISNLLVDHHAVDNGVPVLWWRSVGHSFTAFVVECFLYELAAANGTDPLTLRLGLLEGHPRHQAVLKLAAEKAGWGRPLAPGRGRGIAVHDSFRSVVAEVAEVSVDERGRPRVHRVVCAVDCGFAVNPDTIHAQMESGVVFGLSAVLDGEITLKDGRVQQSNFHDYPVLRIHEMPEIEVHIVQSGADMGGIGEPAVPPIAPAVCNALYAATGKRIRRLPITPGQLLSSSFDTSEDSAAIG